MSEHSGLIVNGLSVHYGQHQALNQVSLNIKPGEIVVILGANGAGKSTLLRAIGGLATRTGGSLQMNGHPLTTLKAHQIVETGLALVPEGRGIFGDLTVEENLLLGAYAKRARADEQQNLERIYSLFPRLVERRRQIARTMSGGEQQMVAIGRAMMSSPSILMLDEPSLGLSPLLSSDVFKTCKAVRETGVGILLVEQNAKQSLSIADRGYLLENGHIIAENSAQNLLNDPAVQQAYLGGSGAAAPTAKPLASAPATVKESLAAESAKQPSSRRTVPDRFEMPRVNAAQVLGVSVNEAIRSAEARQKAAWVPGNTGNKAPLQAHPESVSGSGALADMLRRFEHSAAQAQRPTTAGSPDVRTSRPDNAQPVQTPAETVATEPSSSTPVLEVYRRVVDDHGRSELALVDKRKV